MITFHHVKSWPEFFVQVWRGDKGAELRLNDRSYQVGDVLVQHEWIPEESRYTGRVIAGRISCVVFHTEHLAPGYAMLCLRELHLFDGMTDKQTQDAIDRYFPH